MNKENFPEIIDDLRAADIVIIYEDINKYCLGIDTKKPGNSGAQWLRKRIPIFLEKADKETKHVFEKFFEYKKDSEGNIERDKNNASMRAYGADSCSEDEKKKIFKFIDNEKELMLKKRWDKENEFTWCDYLLTTSDKEEIWEKYITDFENKVDNRKNTLAGKIKLLKVDDLLNKDITFEKMAVTKTNFKFGSSISFKPYGAKQPDLQFFLDKNAFEKNELTISFDLEGKKIN